MPAVTPAWNLPYPCAGDTIDPAIFCNFSSAVDIALSVVAANADFVAHRPNARVDRTANATTYVPGLAGNVTFNTEVFDNNNFASLGVDNTLVTIQTPGLYWASFSLGGFSVFTTWTRYLMNITQNGTGRIYRKFLVNTAQSTPTDNTISGVLQCQAGDQIRAQFTFIGTGGPMEISRGSLSLSFICDL